MEKPYNKKNNGTKLRSRLYPRYDLESSIRFIGTVQKLGGASISNQAVAGELGKAVTNSTFTGRVSSSKQFGLLRQDSGKLSVSSLGKEILVPRGDAQKNLAIRRALSEPELYKELVNYFAGRNLPDEEALANLLYHDYGIQASAKVSATKNFIRSVEYAGVLKNGILVVSGMNEKTANEEPAGDDEAHLSYQPPENISVKNDSPKIETAKFQDSGNGWSIIIKSFRPLNSETKKKLIEVAELLDNVNEQDNDE